MTNKTKDAIIKLLNGVTDKADKLNSIEEKNKFYHKCLANNVDFIEIDDCDLPLDLESEEINEIIADNFLSIVVSKPIVFSDDGYKPWLEDARKDIVWNFYNRYERYLFDMKKWKAKAISDIKKMSDIILDHIENPKTDNLFHKRGLVMGDIQSGKTANYTAVINKALDVGYKIIIVLAGLTRDLRNQTQKRLDSEVLGFETKTNGKGKSIGVGSIKPLGIEGLTYADENKDFGDMKKYFSRHTLDGNLTPTVAIVKKNKSVLEHLNNFLTSSQDYCYTNKKLDIPVLIIDDEVDQASVDTKDSKTLEEASAINRQIRTILNNLNRYSYIGYTATPFANVFIDPDKGADHENEDLYPKDFIICLPTNEDYCGIKEYFGVDAMDDEDDSNDHTSDLFVNIDDYKDMFSEEVRLDAQTSSIRLNNSIVEAIKSFIIASSVKKARGIVEHNSMLVHIARFKNPSTTLKPLIQEYIDELYNKLKYQYYSVEDEFKEFWQQNFEGISKKRLGEKYNDSWDKISEYLLLAVESIQQNIKVLNGDSGDVLDYSLSKTGDFIILGGDKLSRGLTLDGLVVSYYYRNSRAYDSLLQMGRWFGYRKGWIDLCRVYTTIKFMNDFITVGKVLQRFKNDVEEMRTLNLNPREVGQRIMYSPNLIPTARNKMKSSTKVKVSFAGHVQQIITFDRRQTAENLKMTDRFISSLGEGEVHDNNKVVFRNVSANKILEYLKNYKECSGYYDYGHISVANWIKYINNRIEDGELNNWTIVLSSLASDYDNSITIGGHKINKIRRTLREAGDPSTFDLYRIKTNIDPTDFREFFPVDSEEYKTVKSYDSTKEYDGFDENTAVMAIYVVDLYQKILTGEYDKKTNKEKAKRGSIISDGISVCAPAIWFPNTEHYDQSAVMFYVSKDYLDRERREEENAKIEFGGEEDA